MHYTNVKKIIESACNGINEEHIRQLHPIKNIHFTDQQIPVDL